MLCVCLHAAHDVRPGSATGGWDPVGGLDNGSKPPPLFACHFLVSVLSTGIFMSHFF